MTYFLAVKGTVSNIWRPDRSEKLSPAAQAAQLQQQVCWEQVEAAPQLLHGLGWGQGGRRGEAGAGSALCSLLLEVTHQPAASAPTGNLLEMQSLALPWISLDLNLHFNKFPR